MDNLETGLFVVVVLLVIFIGFTGSVFMQEIEKCKRDNDVYECAMVAVPVKRGKEDE